MKHGGSSHRLRPQGQDYRALFAAAVERNGRVDDRACTVAADRKKLQTTINLLAVDATTHSYERVRGGGGQPGGHNSAMGEYAAALEMVGTAEKAMREGPGDLA